MKLIRDTPAEELAARYSLVVPFATAAVCFVLRGTGQIVFHQSEAIVSRRTLAAYVLWLMVSSLLAGLVSLSGIRRCRVRSIFWKAAIGILLSLLVGYLALPALIPEDFFKQ